MPKMPRLRRLRQLRGCRSIISAVPFAAAALLSVGCSSVPTVVDNAQPHEAMFPTLTLNDDLVKWIKPSNQRDWTPEQAVLAYADFRAQRGHGPQHSQLSMANGRRR